MGDRVRNPTQGDSRNKAKRKPDDNAEPSRILRSHKRGRQDEEITRLGESSSPESVAPTVFLDQYGVGLICALHMELAAVECMLDETHEHNIQPPNDSNTYVLGKIADHNVVVACLPNKGYGTNNAAVVATNMRRTFPSVKAYLLVGIGGGVNNPKVDLRLGDVVISDGVYQHDIGKVQRQGRLVRTGASRALPNSLGTAVNRLKSKHEYSQSQTTTYMEEMLCRYPKMKDYAYPGAGLDYLFQSSYEHDQSSEEGCESCDKTKLVSRTGRATTAPKIHHGTVASANQVIKHGRTRDQVMQEVHNMCFEMEGAGLGDFPAVVIRGISDYSDSHKNNRWQRYAAATAAACAKELLSVMPGRKVSKGRASGSKKTSKSSISEDAPMSPIASGSIAHQGKVIQVRGMKTGDKGKQVIMAAGGENIQASDVIARNNGVQLIGSVGSGSGMFDLLQTLFQPRNREQDEEDDEVVLQRQTSTSGSRS